MGRGSEARVHIVEPVATLRARAMVTGSTASQDVTGVPTGFLPAVVLCLPSSRSYSAPFCRPTADLRKVERSSYQSRPASGSRR